MAYFGKKLVIGSDHAGYEIKMHLVAYFSDLGYTFEDKGCFSTESVDYPDYAAAVCQAYLSGDHDFAVLICGSGNGMAMAANKYKGIRAALCWTAEIARLARLHNDANVLVIPGRFVTGGEAEDIFKAFMITVFEGGRHVKRVEKMDHLPV